MSLPSSPITMKPVEKIKVLLVDDHQLIRDGVQSMLKGTVNIDVIGSVSSGEEAINEKRKSNQTGHPK